MRAAGSSLALSVSLRSPALPKGEPLAWRYSFRLKPSPAGGRWRVAPDEGQTVCDFLQRHAFAESGATTAVFRHDPTCEKRGSEKPAGFSEPLIILNNSSSGYAQSKRGAHLKSFVPALPRSGTSCASAHIILRIGANIIAQAHHCAQAARIPDRLTAGWPSRSGCGCDGPASPPQRCSRRRWAQ